MPHIVADGDLFLRVEDVDEFSIGRQLVAASFANAMQPFSRGTSTNAIQIVVVLAAGCTGQKAASTW